MVGQVPQESTGPDARALRTVSRGWRSLALSGSSTETVASLPGVSSIWLQLSAARATCLHDRPTMPTRKAIIREHLCFIEHLPGSDRLGAHLREPRYRLRPRSRVFVIGPGPARSEE